MHSIATRPVEETALTVPTPRLCSTCHLPPLSTLKRGRCNACDSYWRKYGYERPPHLWGRDFTGRLAERLAATSG